MLLLPLIFFCFLTFTTTIGASGVSPSKPQRPTILDQIPEDAFTPQNSPPTSPPVLEGPEGPEAPVDRVHGHFVHPNNPQPGAEFEILELKDNLDPDDLDFFINELKVDLGGDNLEMIYSPGKSEWSRGETPRIKVRWTEEKKDCWFSEGDVYISSVRPFYTLFLIAFKDGISENEKKNYVTTKSEERRGTMPRSAFMAWFDTLELDKKILAMVALIPPREIDSWQDEIVDFIWQERDTFHETMDPFEMPVKQPQPNEDIINTPSEGRERPKGKLLYQNSPRDLGMISKPQKDAQPLPENSFGRFEFLDWAGIDQIVHVHSEGVNAQHREFKDLTGTLTLLNHERKIGKYFRKIDKSLYAMGTDGNIIVSHITGNSLGVVKHASVRMTLPLPGYGSLAWTLASWQTIVEDVRRLRQEQDNYVPVICLPYQIQIPDGDWTQQLVELFEKYFRAMVKEDAFISVGGFFNDGTLDKTGQPRYPAAFARKDEFKENMIVAGTVNFQGELVKNSQNSLIQVAAPGQEEGKGNNGIRCPKPPRTRNKFYANIDSSVYIYVEGGAARSSPAYIAGLAAYYLSFDAKLRGPGGGALVAGRIREKAQLHKKCDVCKPVVYNDAGAQAGYDDPMLYEPSRTILNLKARKRSWLYDL